MPSKEDRRGEIAQAPLVGLAPDDVLSNFVVHGKVLQFSPKSLFLFGEDSVFRQVCVWLITWKWFERLVIFLILANTVILAIVDYRLSSVDTETMQPDPDLSWRNLVIERTELVFTSLFTVEMCLKVVGMGFILDEGCYLRDGWNWLDFIVVTSGLLSIIQVGGSQLSVLRTFRVLRPLRSLTVMRGLRVLVGSLLSSIPQLVGVLALFSFVFLVLGILGLQLWAGILHARCRLTEFPVSIPPADLLEPAPGVEPVFWEMTSTFFAGPNATTAAAFAAASAYVNGVLTDRMTYPYCDAGEPVSPGSTDVFPESGIPLDDSDWDKSSSPWSTPRDCVWPIDEEDELVCSLSGSGAHSCEVDRVCGSNFDDFGNERFVDSRVMRSGTFIAALNFGLTNFDNIARAFLTIFQCITLEGWVDIQYQVQDAYFPSAVASIYFVILVVFGSFFLLNLALAVIWENFAAGQLAEREAQDALLIMDQAKKQAELDAEAAAEKQVSEAPRTPSAMVLQRRQEILGDFGGTSRLTTISRVLNGAVPQPASPAALPKVEAVSKARLKVAAVVSSGRFGALIICLILANTLVLALDHHPMDRDFQDGLEACNFALTTLFFMEMVLKMYGMGLRAYAGDPFNVFDAFIVLVSIIELIVTPPTFAVGGDSEGGAVSALRTFRLFRVFKLARNWVSLRVLLITIAKTLKDVANFSILLGLFVFIFALVGMQLFANRFRFDPNTNLALDISDPGYHDAEVPRSNFDDLLAASVTIFQVLTVENWNTVMYDGWRAAGLVAVVYFVALVVIGNFIVLNLFLAILLGNFDGLEALSTQENEKQAAMNSARGSSRALNTRNVPKWRRYLMCSCKAVASMADDHALKAYEDLLARHEAFQRSTLPIAELQHLKSSPSVSPVHRRMPGTTLAVASVHPRSHLHGASVPKLDLTDVNTTFSPPRDIKEEPAEVLSKPSPPRRLPPPEIITPQPSPPPSPTTTSPKAPENLSGPDPVLGDAETMVESAFQATHPSPQASPVSRPRSRDSRQSPSSHTSNVDAESDWGERVRSTSRSPRRSHGSRPRSGELVRRRGRRRSRASDGSLDRSPTSRSPRRLSPDSRSPSSGRQPQRGPSSRRLSPGRAGAAAGTSAGGTRRNSASSGLFGGLRPPVRSFPTRASRPPSALSQLDSMHSVLPASKKVAPAGAVSALPRALFFLEWDHPARQFCTAVIKHRFFEPTVLVLIALSSVALAIDEPLRDPDSTMVAVLAVADVVFAVLFTIELMLKVISMGFVMHQGSYLRSAWNKLDGFIVVVSWVNIFTGNSEVNALRSLRALRGFRPLRFISRNPGLKLVVNALAAAIPQILNVLFVCVLFFLIFGIVGVNYFKGAFNSCSGDVYDSLSPEQQAYITVPSDHSDVLLSMGCGPSRGRSGLVSKDVCECFGATWSSTRDQSFDNIVSAMRTLFEMSTTEQWVDIMNAGVDSRGVDMQPVENNNRAWVVFFILFMIVGGFFVMNLFVGVVIDNFNRMKEELGENMLLTEAQREWVKTQEQMLHVRLTAKARRPTSLVRGFAFDIIQHGSFEPFIMICILSNTLVLALSYFGMPDNLANGLESANLFFAGVFTMEAVLKIMGLGKMYWADNWNRFDFVIVLGTDGGLVASWISRVDVGSLATLVRAFRVGRIIRLVRSARSLRVLFTTLLVTLPSLANVGSLLFLLLFVYSVMGMQLFGVVQFQDNIDVHANFRTFFSSFLLLIRSSTGENWNGLMADVASSPAGCVANPEFDAPVINGCGSPFFAYFYFISFELLVAFIMLNVFIAVILEGFGDIASQEDARLSTEQMETFASTWVELDPDATRMMSTHNFKAFVQMLPAPMGLGLDDDVPASDAEVLAFIRELNVPTYNGNLVHFSDVALACARRVINKSIQEKGMVLEELPDDHKVARKWALLKSDATVEVSQFQIRHFYSANTVLQAFRTHRFRKRLAEIVGDSSETDTLSVHSEEGVQEYKSHPLLNLKAQSAW